MASQGPGWLAEQRFLDHTEMESLFSNFGAPEFKGSAHISWQILPAHQEKKAKLVAFSSVFWETEAQSKHTAAGSSSGPRFWEESPLWQGVCRRLIHTARGLVSRVEVEAVAEPEALDNWR